MRLTAQIRDELASRCGGSRGHLEALARHADDEAVEFAQLAIHHGYLDRDGGGDVLGVAMGHTYVNLGKTLFQDEVLEHVPAEFASRNAVIPLYKLGDAVTVAMARAPRARARPPRSTRRSTSSTGRTSTW